jgi:hypothetical protein
VPIKVRCPNPACAQFHLVKDRWAGKRGTCPACGSVIAVPSVQRDTTPLAPLPNDPEVQAPPEEAEMDTTSVEDVLADEVLEEEEEYDEAPRRRPSWWTRPLTILTLAGLVVFLLVALVPLLPGPTTLVTRKNPSWKGDPPFAAHTVRPDDVTTLIVLVVLGCCLGVAGLVLSRRRHDWVALLPVYLALGLTGLALMLVIHQQPYGAEQVETYTNRVSALGGQASGEPGSGINIGIGIAAVALLVLAAAVIVGHRTLWARLVSAGSILVATLLVAVVLFLGVWS